MGSLPVHTRSWWNWPIRRIRLSPAKLLPSQSRNRRAWKCITDKLFMNKGKFRIPNKVIWASSAFLGILASVPKIAEHHFNAYEAIINSLVTFLFAVFIWYYNILTLPAYSSRDVANGFSIVRLAKSLLFGIAVMFLLACVQQLL